MENREKTVEKRTQQDYTMAFKLGIVSRVEKGEFIRYKYYPKICNFSSQICLASSVF